MNIINKFLSIFSGKNNNSQSITPAAEAKVSFYFTAEQIDRILYKHLASERPELKHLGWGSPGHNYGRSIEFYAVLKEEE